MKTDPMFADEIAHGLGTRVIGRQILSYEDLDSTNRTAFQSGERGAREGLCIFAEHQRKGRGRLGRSWVSPKGKNILLSVLLKPRLEPSQVSKLTLLAAVSIVKTIRNVTGRSLGIKWPNDVVHRESKVCGILTEMSAESDRVHFVVVGIGINVNAGRRELPPHSTSLKEITRRKLSRLEVARELLRQLERDYARFVSEGSEDLSREWEELSVTSGRRVSATLAGRTLHGQATGIDHDGALWIRTDNGLQEKITAGDIRHLR